MITFDAKVPMPKVRSYRVRLTDSLKKIKPGQSILLDPETARCLAAYLRRNSMRPAARAEGKKIRVWRGK